MDIEKFENEIDIDTTTLFLYEEVVYCISEDYEDMELNDDLKEIIINYCSTYNYDWSVGLAYDDIDNIIEAIREDYKY